MSPITTHSTSSRRGAIVLLLTGALIASGSPTSHATYYSGGMPARSFNIQAVGINSVWVGHLDTARSNWNSSGAGVSIGRTSNSKATFTAAHYAQTWLGLYAPSGVRGVNRVFSIKVNARTLNASAGSNLSQWIRSTSTHELGHALSLADNPSTSASSLMKHDRNRATLTKPTSYDVAEVKRIYS